MPASRPPSLRARTSEFAVGACQMTPVYGDVDASLRQIERALQWAQSERLDVLCLPECFLTGYFRTRSDAIAHGLDLDSAPFRALLSRIEDYDPHVIVGLIERSSGKLFNTAAIVERGELVGRYRKRHPNERGFAAGDASPVFERRGVRFGVNICNDANFPESSLALAAQGASVLFYPLNNSLQPHTARKWRHRHLPNLVARARDCSAWVISADVVEASQRRVGYGCTAIVDPTGAVADRCEELRPGRIALRLADVPCTAAPLSPPDDRRTADSLQVRRARPPVRAR